MINKDTYKRLTERRDSLVIDNCGNCPNVNNPQGCTVKKCYEIMKNRLAELEDKITDGTLRDIKVNIGDTIFLVDFIDVSSYSEGLKFIEILEPWEVNKIDIYKDDIIYRLTHNGTEDYNTAHGKEYGENWFITKSEAEAKLKELREKEE